MIFGPDGTQIPGQGQPNWNPLQYLQNLPNFINGNQQALSYLEANLPQFLTNPANFPGLVTYFIAWQTYRVVNWTLRTLRFLVQMAPLLLPAFLNLATVNLGGLAGLAGLAQPPAPVVPPAPMPVTGTQQLPPPALLLAAPALAPAPAPLPTPSTAPTVPAPATPAGPPIPATGAEGFSYLVGGPGPGVGWGMGARIAATDTASETAAAPGVLAAHRDAVRSVRRQRAGLGRGYRYEFLDSDGDASEDEFTSPRYAPSEKGAGAMGFAGTSSSVAARPTGLTTLAGDEFGGGPGLPLLPETWRPDAH